MGDCDGVPVAVTVGVGLGSTHTGGRSGHSTAASAIRSQNAPRAAAVGTTSAAAMNGFDAYCQQMTPAVLARTAHAKPAPISTATTSPCSPAGSDDVSDGSPQHVTKPVAFTAHARHCPAASVTVDPCTLAGGACMFASHCDADHQQVTVPAGKPADSAHVPVDRAASARTCVPAARRAGTFASVPPEGVRHDTAPLVESAQA